MADRRRRVLAFLRSRGMSQNQLAQAIGRDATLVSKVLRGVVASAPIWAEVEAFMADPDGYKPVAIRDRKQREAISRARALLRRSGMSA